MGLKRAPSAARCSLALPNPILLLLKISVSPLIQNSLVPAPLRLGAHPFVSHTYTCVIVLSCLFPTCYQILGFALALLALSIDVAIFPCQDLLMPASCESNGYPLVQQRLCQILHKTHDAHSGASPPRALCSMQHVYLTLTSRVVRAWAESSPRQTTCFVVPLIGLWPPKIAVSICLPPGIPQAQGSQVAG